jgi:hypothetical protein
VSPSVGQVWCKSKRKAKAGQNTYTSNEYREVIFVGYDPFVCRTLVGKGGRADRREVNSGIKAWNKWCRGAVLVAERHPGGRVMGIQ